MNKVRYTEEKPIKREIYFSSKEDYYAFWNEYYSKILDYCWDNKIKIDDYYIYRHYKLNKNGSPRKYYYPKHLHSKKATENQREGFLKYVEIRKKKTLLRNQKRWIMENELKMDECRKKITELQNENLAFIKANEVLENEIK